MVDDKLMDVHPDQTFKEKDGKEIRNLRQLLSVLNDISPDSFRHHVNAEKNDFSSWIMHSVKDNELADKLRTTIDFEETKKIINDRVMDLEKAQQIDEMNFSVGDIGIDKPEIVIERPPSLEPIKQEPIAHPFEQVKKGFAHTMRDVLIGFVAGLLIGYMLHAML
jgi:hypothetical protein